MRLAVLLGREFFDACLYEPEQMNGVAEMIAPYRLAESQNDLPTFAASVAQTHRYNRYGSTGFFLRCPENRYKTRPEGQEFVGICFRCIDGIDIGVALGENDDNSTLHQQFGRLVQG